MNNDSGYLYAIPFDPIGARVTAYAIALEEWPIPAPQVYPVPCQIYPNQLIRYPSVPEITEDPENDGVKSIIDMCKIRVETLNDLIEKMQAEKEVLEKMIAISEQQK